FVSYSRDILCEKASYVAGWMYFVNRAMTRMGDITAVALYMVYLGEVWGVRQCVGALGAVASVGRRKRSGVGGGGVGVNHQGGVCGHRMGPGGLAFFWGVALGVCVFG
ncbi:hypothetical protein LXA69_17425, partial [Erwinia amylovora]|nr:hypothetical protein [Erwinia amylovora]